MTYLAADSITASSKKGVVTLTGTVADVFHKDLAQDTVEGLPGVKKVDNQLTIAEKDKSGNIDHWLGVRVKTALLFHRNVRTAQTNVSVTDRVVTLTGVAATQAQKDLITEYTSDITDVKSVKNKMTIAQTPVSSPAPGRTKEDHIPSTVVSSGANTINTAKNQKALSIFKNSDGESLDDASITAQVKSSLRINRKTSALKPNVRTHKGTVTLSGAVTNNIQKELVSHLANDIYGVVNVVNNMRVKPI